MTTQADILTCIADGRLAVERTVAFSMACTLAKVEAMVREMRPAGPVTIERGNTADLADLAKMQDILDGQGYAPTSAGLYEMLDDLNEALELARNASNQHDEIIPLRSEVARLGRAIVANSAEHEQVKREQGRLWLEAQESIGQRQRDNEALRAKVAALTPGPWVRLGDVAPEQGEIVMMHAGVGGAPWVQLISETTVQHLSATYSWRRLPAGILDVPAPAVTP